MAAVGKKILRDWEKEIPETTKPFNQIIHALNYAPGADDLNHEDWNEIRDISSGIVQDINNLVKAISKTRKNIVIPQEKKFNVQMGDGNNSVTRMGRRPADVAEQIIDELESNGNKEWVISYIENGHIVYYESCGNCNINYQLKIIITEVVTGGGD